MANIPQLIADINTNITSKTADNSITPTILGNQMVAMTGGLRPYLTYSALMTLDDSGNPTTLNVLENQLGAVTVSHALNASSWLFNIPTVYKNPDNYKLVMLAMGGNNGAQAGVFPVITGSEVDGIPYVEAYDAAQGIALPTLYNCYVEIRAYPINS